MKMGTRLRCAALAIALIAGAAHAEVLLTDPFTAPRDLAGAVVNTNDLNQNIARQGGTLAPVTYSMAFGPGHYGHQLGNLNAVDELLVADFPASTSSLNRNFNGALSQGGLRIVFDLDSLPQVYTGYGSDNWGAVNLGASQADQLVNVNQGLTHFGILFRDDGRIQAFDGATVVTPNPEPTYTSAPGGVHHIELLITDADGNPFDGSGDTTIEAFADGSTTPSFSFTKAGGYSDNFINFQGSARAHFDNLVIERVPEPGSAAVLGLGSLSLLLRRRRA
jgi:hypothetical protein